jgi:hypothetical protein
MDKSSTDALLDKWMLTTTKYLPATNTTLLTEWSHSPITSELNPDLKVTIAALTTTDLVLQATFGYEDLKPETSSEMTGETWISYIYYALTSHITGPIPLSSELQQQEDAHSLVIKTLAGSMRVVLGSLSLKPLADTDGKHRRTIMMKVMKRIDLLYKSFVTLQTSIDTLKTETESAVKVAQEAVDMKEKMEEKLLQGVTAILNGKKARIRELELELSLRVNDINDGAASAVDHDSDIERVKGKGKNKAAPKKKVTKRKRVNSPSPTTEESD